MTLYFFINNWTSVFFRWVWCNKSDFRQFYSFQKYWFPLPIASRCSNLAKF